MCNHTHENHGHHNHNHELFSDINSKMKFQMSDLPLQIEDTKEVAKGKMALEQSKSYENYVALGSALCFQLRYREGARAFEAAIGLDEKAILAHRKVALCYLKTNQLEKAEKEFAICNLETPNSLDIVYRQGLVAYYMADYRKAKALFFRSFELSIGNDEMYIAVIYWYILSCAKLCEPLDYVKSLYSDKINCGHHLGYDLAVKLFCGIDSETHLYEVAKLNDEMTFTIFLYGNYVFNQMQNDNVKAKILIDELMRLDKYWASFAYLGAIYDISKEKRK